MMKTALFAVFAFALCGCGHSAKNAAVRGNDQREALGEIGQLLKRLSTEGRLPPGKLAELEAVEPLLPVAGPLIRSGIVVYVWGTPYRADGSAVAAYEKQVAEEGGHVLLQDGAIREMTVEEFKTAMKAKK